MTFSRSLGALVAAAWLAAGCGDGEQAASAPATKTTGGQPTTIRYVAPSVIQHDSSGLPSLGCDAGPECLLQWAVHSLDRCAESRLTPAGEHARHELQRLVAQITDAGNTASIDDHNATMRAYDDLLEAC